MTKVISPANIEERKKLDIRAGDTIKVTLKIVEKDKKTGKPRTRPQDFEGSVLAVKHGKEAGGSVTVRKIASGVGVERIFPIYSPMIEKIEIVKRSKVRQAKLYHIREKAAKEIRRQMRNIRELPEEEPEELNQESGIMNQAEEESKETETEQEPEKENSKELKKEETGEKSEN